VPRRLALRVARAFIPARVRRPRQVRGAADEFAFVLYFGFDEADPIYDRRAPEARARGRLARGAAACRQLQVRACGG